MSKRQKVADVVVPLAEQADMITRLPSDIIEHQLVPYLDTVDRVRFLCRTSSAFGSRYGYSHIIGSADKPVRVEAYYITHYRIAMRASLGSFLSRRTLMGRPMQCELILRYAPKSPEPREQVYHTDHYVQKGYMNIAVVHAKGMLALAYLRPNMGGGLLANATHVTVGYGYWPASIPLPPSPISSRIDIFSRVESVYFDVYPLGHPESALITDFMRALHPRVVMSFTLLSRSLFTHANIPHGRVRRALQLSFTPRSFYEGAMPGHAASFNDAAVLAALRPAMEDTIQVMKKSSIVSIIGVPPDFFYIADRLLHMFAMSGASHPNITVSLAVNPPQIAAPLSPAAASVCATLLLTIRYSPADAARLVEFLRGLEHFTSLTTIRLTIVHTGLASLSHFIAFLPTWKIDPALTSFNGTTVLLNWITPPSREELRGVARDMYRAAMLTSESHAREYGPAAVDVATKIANAAFPDEIP